MKVALILAAWFPTIVFAQNASAPDCQKYQDVITSDEQKYQGEFQDDQNQSDQIKQDSATFNGTVTWKDETIIFNVPSVTVKNQKLIFGVPQVTVNNRHVIFDTPSVTMTMVKVGQYPQTTCTDTWIIAGPVKTKGVPSCTVTYHDIMTNVPKTIVQHQDIVIGIPEFTLANTQVVIGVPEITSRQVKWVLGLPQFTVKSIALNEKKVQDESNALQDDVASKKQNMVTDVSNDIHNEYGCFRSSVASQRVTAETQFNTALSQLDASIQSVRGMGADPSNLKDATGNVTNLVAQRNDLQTKKDQALASFDAALKNLDDSEKQTVASITQ